MLGLHETSMLYVHLPSSLVSLIPSLAVIDAIAVLLVVGKRSLKGIAVGVGKCSLSIQLVLDEGTLIGEGITPLGKNELAHSLLVALHEIPLVVITIAVAQLTAAVELARQERTLVGLVLVDVPTLASLLIVMKFTLITDPIALLKHSLSLLLAHPEGSLVLSIILKVFQFAKAMELILVKFSLVLSHSLEEVLALALLHALLKGTLVAQTTGGLEGALPVLVMIELPSELVAVGQYELAVGTLLLSVLHGALETRPVHIYHLSSCKLPIGKNALEDTNCFLMPLAITMCLGVHVEITLVVISTLESKSAVVTYTLHKLAYKDRLI